MKKEEIYVQVDTPEKCIEAYKILTEAKEPIFCVSADSLSNARLSGGDKLYFDIELEDSDWSLWVRTFEESCLEGKTEISLKELENILNGNVIITFTKDYKSFNEAMQSLTTADGNTLFLGFPEDADPDEYMPKLVIDVKEELVNGFWPATATFTYTKIKE